MNNILRTLMVLLPALLLSANASAQHETVLYSFMGGNDGYEAQGTLVADASGNLYGTTTWGGSQVTCGGDPGCGTVFELTPLPGGGWTETVLYSFLGGSDGGEPGYGALILDAAGNLYGTTLQGGTATDACPQGCGTVFELTPPPQPGGAWSETVLHSFQGGSSDAALPTSGVVFDQNGNLYGNTIEGGSGGTVFELSPPQVPGGAWTETLIYTFNGSSDGVSPFGALLFEPPDDLYGTTFFGGSRCPPGGCGTVFNLHHSSDGSWSESILYSFGGVDGNNPEAGVIPCRHAVANTTTLRLCG